MPTPYETFSAFIRRYADEQLTAYVASLHAASRRPQARELNDPVWGTVFVRPAESVIIDSPLFQKLKDTRQLGVAHHVYPSANHTRFEHSLGALHVVSKLIDAVRANAIATETPTPIPDALIPVIRLAALLHDVGHGAMSHVTENALEMTEWADDVVLAAGNRHDVIDQHSLTEIAAVEIIMSKPFFDLLNYICSVTPLSSPHQLAIQVTRAIAGFPIDERFPFLSDLISGPFDADKLDYISRDSQFCGLPQVLDTQRLIQKLRTVEVDRDHLPARISARVPGNHASYVMTGVASSGAGTLDELALARALLHDKVYRHHKTRAFEAMIAGLIELATETVDNGYVLPWMVADPELVSLRSSELVARYGRRSRTARQRRLLDLYDWILNCYRQRLDYVAAYAWFIDLSGYGPTMRQQQQDAFHRLEIASRESSRRNELRALIVDEFWRAYDLLDSPPDVPVTVRADLKYLISIDCVRAGSRLSRRSVLENAYLINRRDDVIPFPEVTSDSDALGGYYVANRDISYVYCPRPLAPLVGVVVETVFSDAFGVRTTDAMDARRHADDDELDEMRRKLQGAGYFDSRPPHLLPVPTFLQSAQTRNRLTRIAQRWVKYEPPQLDRGELSREAITMQDIETFIRQFRDPKHAEVCLEMLDSVVVLSRDDLRRAFVPVLDDVVSQATSPAVAPLGGPDESAAYVVYAMTDILHGHRLSRPVWADQLTDAADHVVFLDDFIGSGARLLGTVAGWLGVDLVGASATRPSVLPDAARAALTTRPITFAFARHHSDGYARAESVLRDVADLNVSVRVSDIPVPTVQELDVAASRRASFLRELRRIDHQLMIAAGKSESEAADRELGRSNWGLLLATSLNTPAQTVTALWMRGQVDGFEWQPLFPRRP